MSVPINKKLYETVVQDADRIYKKPSAYKSRYIVKEYKKRGGKYVGKKPVNKGLDRWFKEDWRDVGKRDYPVYRPTKRITKDTPLTVSEIDKKDLQKKIEKKQIIKGSQNLKPFKKKSQ